MASGSSSVHVPGAVKRAAGVRKKAPFLRAGQAREAKTEEVLLGSRFSLLLLRVRMRKKTYLAAKLRICQRTWLRLGPKSKQETTHGNRMGNAAIDIRADRKTGGVSIWVRV